MPDRPDLTILDLPYGERPDPDAFVQAAMEWHFNPDTGSPFWLARAASLPFDPRTDVRTIADLTLFPNVTAELREVPARDLIPRGYGPNPPVVGVYESGGTTGAPKRVVCLSDWMDRLTRGLSAGLDALGVPRGLDWLAIAPSGPHMVGEMVGRAAERHGGIMFRIDMDPRWVKKLFATGRTEEAEAYVDHVIEQAAPILRTQDIGVLMTTPPLLERIARHDDLIELIGQKVRGVMWGGAHMDADTRDLLRTEVFPHSRLYGTYGNTMMLGGATERLGLADDEPCVFDPQEPYVTFSVIDPATGKPVEYGEFGQVVMSHVSKSCLLPNNLERDLALRVPGLPGAVGDSVADVGPVAVFDNEAVVEGVY
ncbi:phenazine antibiotic biosynthesis protein [Streptomyces sp. B1866]|uniref:phenazine antibiotic biosynthesis protein n=1 Tax=Streptomyces sp. B1866 TaxID=3075431 RepID=UPI00288E34D9|nr:phenazine antibiotic biosynthesis protein [Streptomyces sp. B1866]MDT3398361.1 phenazine antibiotic biosynthesis protein [Streptomyces sp. B1866]